MITLEKAARQALEVLKSSRVFVTTREKIKHPEGTETYDEIVEALRQALEPPKQEPVLWGCKFNKGNRLDTFYTKGAAERFVEGSLRNGADVSLVGLYTEPPQREWVGLTDEEVRSIDTSEFWNDNTPLDFARVIEAKLKELNS
jgi:hypothetical protein